YEFWTRAFDPSNDKNIMKMLYEKSFLNPNPSDVPDVSNEFWYCFQCSLMKTNVVMMGKTVLYPQLLTDSPMMNYRRI
ncbi:20372_t:CDS:1, partial [Entrophospora sp. SA101]